MEIYENRNLEDLDGEIWKEIEGYDGDYFVSNLGRVKSFKRYKEGKILEPNKNNSSGYLRVYLYKNGEKPKNKQIHVLIYENHIRKIPEGYVIHHIDFSKDNFLENLQMMTKGEHNTVHHKNKIISEGTKKLMSENHADFKGEKHPMFGKHHSEKTKELKRGENNPNSILTEQNVIEIRIDLNEEILTQKEIGEKFGVCRKTISLIKHRKLWKHIK